MCKGGYERLFSDFGTVNTEVIILFCLIIFNCFIVFTNLITSLTHFCVGYGLEWIDASKTMSAHTKRHNKTEAN